LRQIAEEQLDDLAVGAAILGTGGGGDPYVGKLLARNAIRSHGPVTVLDVDEVPDDVLVVPTAMMGAPTIMVEKLPSGNEVLHAFEKLAAHLGRGVASTAPIEVGGVNSMIPLVTAARAGVPIVDADMMGRAFPELQMCLPTLYGISASSMAIADDKGNVGILETVDNGWAERLARSLTIEMGCSALIALYAVDGRQVKETMIPGTLRLGEELERLVRETREEHGDVVQAVTDRLGGHVLFEGKIVDVARQTSGGFARAETRVAGTGEYAESTAVLRSQNEFLVAERDGEVAASTPDLIIALDTQTGEPVTTEAMRYGFRVTVLARPAIPVGERLRGYNSSGPRYFGYDIEYETIDRGVYHTTA
jgi:uncharacterized protein